MIGFFDPSLDAGTQTIQVTPTRLIGPFRAQVTIEERHRDDLVITDHPVESGAVISDHAYKLPSGVMIRAGWSESPTGDSGPGGLLDDSGAFDGLSGLTSMTSGEGVGSVREMYENMLQLQASRIPFEILTGKRMYKNMLVRSLETTTDKENENSLVLVIDCREIQIVTTQVVAVGAPPDAQQEPEATTPTVEKGTKQLTDGSKYNAAAGEASAAASATSGATP